MAKTRQDLISQDRYIKENPYAHLDGDGGFDATFVLAKGVTKLAPLITPVGIRTRACPRRMSAVPSSYTFRQIGDVARTVQVALWKHRAQLLPKSESHRPMELLNPELAFKALGFHYDLCDTLGQFALEGKYFEVAGIVDSAAQEVRISRQFPRRVQRFTAAHELGHAVLHEAVGLHRDRPVDGSRPRNQRNQTEWEADAFATTFLMPAKLVAEEFEKRFHTMEFTLTEETIFALATEDEQIVRRQLQDTRRRSRTLAVAQRFGAVRFLSLAEVFGVSAEAMAIRLEELRLVG